MTYFVDYNWIQKTCDCCRVCLEPPWLKRLDGYVIYCDTCGQHTQIKSFKLWEVAVEWNKKQRNI